MAEAAATANPLENLAHPVPFDRIKPEHVIPAVEAMLPELREELRRIEANAQPTWEGVIEPLERLTHNLDLLSQVIGHLMSVKNSDALRAANDKVEPELARFGIEVGQSRPIHDVLESMSEEPIWSSLDAAQQRVIRRLLLDAKNAGVALEGDEKARFTEIQAELTKLSTQFGNNVLDETKAFKVLLTSESEIAGLPLSWRRMAAQSARIAGHAEATPESGPWLGTLDGPSLTSILRFAEDRSLREKFYKAYVTKASSGDRDNTPVMERILVLRREAAKILGYDTHADVELSRRMAKDVDEVRDFLMSLRDAAWSAGNVEVERLNAIAERDGAKTPIEMWDYAYYTEKLRNEELGYSAEELRPYFPFPVVLQGLFDTLGELFGITFDAADGQAPVWHDDVRYFILRDESGTARAALYIDPYSRPAEKSGGAWQNGFVSRSRAVGENRDVQIPVGVTVCNQTPPVGDQPALMTFSEVTTLFHEFGHAIHDLMTNMEYRFVAGTTGVEWDAVEVPSMFMENWCYQPRTLKRISRHVETGESLPDDLIAKIGRSRIFHTGMPLLRNARYSLVDMELHASYQPGGSSTVWKVAEKVDEKTVCWNSYDGDRHLCSFAHIFAGGYAAGYYSYAWAEVMASDIFSAFEEAELDDPASVGKVGRRLRDEWLAQGGGRHPRELFVGFRGREPRIDAYLRHLGLGDGPTS